MKTREKTLPYFQLLLLSHTGKNFAVFSIAITIAWEFQ